MTSNAVAMAEWDAFCFEYNEFAVAHGGKCTFNQTKVLSKSQVERAFGDKWERFKSARDAADPNGRFWSDYFRTLMVGETRAQ